MRYLKQNTATRITVGPFLDKTDGITPEVALTATNEHITFMVDDAGVPTLVIDANATASGGNNDMVHVTGDDAGFYDLELTAAQTNYVGRAILSINYVTDHLPVFHEFMIVPANVYDSLFGTDLLDVNLSKVAETTQTAGDLAALVTTVDTVVDGIETHAHQIDSRILAEYGTTEKAAIDLLDDASGGLADIHTDIGTIDTVVDAIKAKTDQLIFTVANRVDANALQVGDKTGYAIGTGGIAASAFAAGAIDAAALAADAAAEIADKILGRNLAGGSDGGRTVMDALRILRNKRSISGATLTVTAEDDATPAWTATIATTAGDPISSVDPA